MLESLQIRNYVLIDSLDVSFPEGLVIITGQTGAGKSILLGALSLLLGAKADAGVVGASADSCTVEGAFRIPEADAAMAALLEENGIETEDNVLYLRRVVHRSGRSRAYAGEAPVSLPTLQALSSRLVDIHSQHQTLMLSDRGFQRALLDHFAGNDALLETCALAFRRRCELERSLAAARSERDSLARDRDYNEARFKALDDAHLREGELEALEEEQRQLANAGEIKSGLEAARSLLGMEDVEAGGIPVPSLMKEAQKRLDRIAAFLPAAAPLSERLSSLRLELEDVLDELFSLSERVDLSPERLSVVEDRLSLLYGLMKKYDTASIPGLIARREELSAMLYDSDALEETIARLEKEVGTASAHFDACCAALHEARLGAARPFAETVEAAVKALELPYARFEVTLSPAAPGLNGSDAVCFLFSAAGKEPSDLARCASGGELSRLMLCLKAMMARYRNMPTLVFDEIDAGVSGSVADKVGRMICAMGEDMQVLAITHLPQVAAKGDAHYLVEKEYDVSGRSAVTTMRQVTGEERVLEIARMLSGSEILPAAVENARALLGNS